MRRLLVAAVIIVAGLGAWTLYPTFSATRTAPDAQKGKKGTNAVLVVTAPIRIANVQQSFEALGNANANESITISSKVTGVVSSINFTEGQFVNKGQILIELDSRELKATLASAAADESVARDNYTRSAQLLTSGNAAKATVQNLQTTLLGIQARTEAARARLADYTITAPFAGRLGLRRISMGGLVSMGNVLTTLDDVSVIKLDFSVPEVLISRVRPGAALVARSDAYPAQTFQGVVKTIDSRVDPATRAVQVRAEVPNPDAILQPGMLLTAGLTLEQREAAMLVPEEALVPIDTSQYVYTMEAGKAAQKKVTIGERQNGFVEIRDGIARSDRVIVGGLQKIRDGVDVRETRAVAEGS